MCKHNETCSVPPMGTAVAFQLFRLYPFVFALLALWRFALPLRLPLKWRLALALPLAAGCLNTYVYVLTGGTVMDPGLTRRPSICVHALGFSSLALVVLTLLRDLVNLLYRILKFSRSALLIPPGSLIAGALILACSLTFGIRGTLNGFAVPELAEYTVRLKNLPEAADGYTVVLLADTHISAPISRGEIELFTRLSNSAGPDLVVFAGDFVDGPVSALKEKVEPLFKLTARDGLYAVSGNHEFYSGYREWLSFLTRGGFTFLENKSVIIRDPAGTALFNLAGVSDRNALRFNAPGPDFDRALARTDPVLPIIILCHQPVEAYRVLGQADLFLAGHTHGGHAPIVRQLIAAANHGLVSGLYDLGRLQVLVTNGTREWMGFPLRILTPPQIVKITLRRG